MPNIYTVADTLLSDGGWVTYQWYYNGNAIPGADSVTHVPADTGYYYVEVWDTNGCPINSDSTYVSSAMAIGEINAEQQFIVYPNPSNGSVTLEFPLQNANSVVTIHNLAGQVLFQQNTSGLNKLQLNFPEFSAGSYIIRFIGDDGQVQTRNLIIH